MASSLKEFSVIYTERATNLMSGAFVKCMNDIILDLTEVYNCQKCALIPGSGSMAMEAVARQFTNSESKVVIVRNGFFSYRWSQIFESSNIIIEDIVHGRLNIYIYIWHFPGCCCVRRPFRAATAIDPIQ